MKSKYIPFLLIPVLLLASCKAQTQSRSSNQQTAPTTTPLPTSQSPQDQDKNAKMMMSAMEVKGSVVCTIAKTDGTDTITYKVKGKKTKAAGKSLGDNKTMGYMISDGEYSYIWNDNEKTGMKISLKQPIPSSGASIPPVSTDDQVGNFSKEEVQREYEERGYTYNCENKDIVDSEFTPPTNITFTDLSKMMEDNLKMYQNLKPGASINPVELKKFEDNMNMMKEENNNE